LPDIGEVPRPAPRHDEDRVDADIVAVAHEARCKAFGGGGDPPQPPRVEREFGGAVACPGLDLDEGERAPAPRNDVDFAAGDAGAPREDPPAVQPQPPGGQPLGAAASLLGQLAAVQRLSSRARA
jgi:hypothetical protein